MRPLPFLVLTALLLTSARADERSTARRFDQAKQDEPSLIAFMRAMPKGGDLHYHAGGGLDAEEGLRTAVRTGMFFNPETNRFQAEKGTNSVPAEQLLHDDRLRYQYLNAATMRGATSGPAGGHDHFFSTFGPLVSGWDKVPEEEAFATLVRRARMQNLQYLEFMEMPYVPALDRMRAAVLATDSPEQMLAKLRPLLDGYTKELNAELDRWDTTISRAAGQASVFAASSPVTLRLQAPAGRLGADTIVPAVTWASAFAAMKTDPRVVGVNLLAPEDHPESESGFTAQMRLLDYLWRRFDHPTVALHAGELNPYVSSLEPMTNHIRRSIEVGHARRIGHGSAVAWEDDCSGLLRKMREEGIAVEICPTSEAVILGLEGERHPFRLYHRAVVPIVICTDDEGVLRTNITLEFVRAVRSWGLSYRDVKELVRNSIEYSFLPGPSLFEGRDYRKIRRGLRELPRHGWIPTPEEAKLLAASDKATVQVRLERALAEFER